MQQRPLGGEDLQGLYIYEQLVNTFVFSAKTYFAMWGPLAVPMIEGADRWAKMQRAYLLQLRQTLNAGNSSVTPQKDTPQSNESEV